MQIFQLTLIDDQGRPVGGAAVSIYVGGTSTLAACYEADGVTGVTNPLTTNPDGYAECHLPNGEYDVVAVKNEQELASYQHSVAYDPDDDGGLGIFKDGDFTIQNTADPTKQVMMDASGITTETVRTVKFQDKNGTIALTEDAAAVQEFRLTLTSGIPVTVSDVTGATTLYCTPYKGNHIALYDGTRWNVRSSAQFSLALGTLTSGRPYDVFCYDNAGTPTLEFLAWTSSTARATALAYQDGVLVKSGATTRRYLGTFCTTATTTTEDSAANRYLWNYYHRVMRPMYWKDGGADHTYTTATWRQWGANTAAQLAFVVGVAEDEIRAEVFAYARNSSSNVPMWAGIGYDSTTTPAATASTSAASLIATVSYVANFNIGLSALHKLIPSAGRHFLALLENSGATGTTTWVSGSGIFGGVMA